MPLLVVFQIIFLLFDRAEAEYEEFPPEMSLSSRGGAGKKKKKRLNGDCTLWLIK